MLADLSYRHKTPLAMSLVILLTAAVVASALTLQGYREALEGFQRHQMALGKTLARTLLPALQHDDTWAAYELLLTPLERPAPPGHILILLDARGRVFAATEPRQFPVQATFAPLLNDPEMAHVQLTGPGREAMVRQGRDGHYLYLVTPVLAEDGALQGQLVQRHDLEQMKPRLAELIAGMAFATLLVLLLLLPLGWLAGKHLAEPLSHLSECLTRVGKELPDAIHCEFPHGRDEIGQLAERFQGMVEELRNKQVLEKHLAQSDRLAAVGRLSAGIAHEINNPLGGMLNAISNYRRRGSPDPHAEKTLALIERGLVQIRDTVSALLVEAKLESRALTPDDLEDVLTLITADAQRKRLQLDWQNRVTEALPLPSAQIRQILLNLLLNAVQASPEDATVSCKLDVSEGRLSLSVSNGGAKIPERRRQHLFEPYFGEGEVHGLGLWVTYQLVHQIRGEIVVDSVPGTTRFRVNLPLDDHAST